MRAIGLVLLSIAIMALLLTDGDAQRRSSAQGSQAGGPQRKLVRDLSQSGPQRQLQLFLGRGGFCRPNPFPGTPYGTGYAWSGPMR